MKNKRLLAILSFIGLVLLIPFVAMQFTNEVNWSSSDFIIMGALLLTTGLACEWVIRKAKVLKYRILYCGIIILALMLIWAELAVGIFGSPIAGS